MVSVGRGTRFAAGRSPRLLLLIVVFVAALVPRPAAASPDCQFSFGFKALHDLIPATVGDCLSNEAYSTTGDSLQLTTGGLLVWRKADNHTAFTNGSTTWVLGPLGLQVRPNNARFAWEPDIAPANVDPRLSASYQIAANSSFGGLIASLIAAKIPIRVASLSDAWGAFSIGQDTPVLYVNQRLLDADPNDAAAVIIHEATHAQDAASRMDLHTPAGCIQAEVRARSNELAFWRDQYGPRGKRPPANAYEAQQDYLLGLAENGLRALVAETLITYERECGLTPRSGA